MTLDMMGPSASLVSEATLKIIPVFLTIAANIK